MVEPRALSPSCGESTISNNISIPFGGITGLSSSCEVASWNFGSTVTLGSISRTIGEVLICSCDYQIYMDSWDLISRKQSVIPLRQASLRWNERWLPWCRSRDSSSKNKSICNLITTRGGFILIIIELRVIVAVAHRRSIVIISKSLTVWSSLHSSIKCELVGILSNRCVRIGTGLLLREDPVVTISDALVPFFIQWRPRNWIGVHVFRPICVFDLTRISMSILDESESGQ